MLLLRTLLLSLFFSLPAHASTLAEELSVFKLSTSVKILLLKYYHVQADEGNPQLVEEVLRHREEVSLQKSLLLEDLGANFPARTQGIQTHWDEFNSLLDENIAEIRESNYPELQVVTMMRKAQRAMLQELELLSDQILAENELTLSELTVWQRQQKNLLLEVVERYIERAASSIGAPLTIDNVDIRVLCQQFERGIADMKSRVTASEAQRQLSKIHSQWLFIETAATDTNARLVPFLVMRYADGILGRLDEVAHHI